VHKTFAKFPYIWLWLLENKAFRKILVGKSENINKMTFSRRIVNEAVIVSNFPYLDIIQSIVLYSKNDHLSVNSFNLMKVMCPL
jgi:hypothetical protein